MYRAAWWKEQSMRGPKKVFKKAPAEAGPGINYDGICSDNTIMKETAGNFVAVAQSRSTQLAADDEIVWLRSRWSFSQCKRRTCMQVGR